MTETFYWPDERTCEEIAWDEAVEAQCQLADLGYFDEDA